MLSFSLVAEALTGLIYHRPSGENSNFQFSLFSCYLNPKQDILDLKSSMCRKVSNVAKTILGFNVTGKELFESIGSLSAPAPPRLFTFTSTKVNSGSKTISKPSTSKSTSPPKPSTKAVPKQPKPTN